MANGNRYGAEAGKTPRARVHPRVRDLAWAAGFLEGEGYFGRSGQVSASQVQREPLACLQAMFGGSIGQRSHRKYNPRQNEYWQWSVSGARARGVAMTMYPLMSPKRQVAIRELFAGRPWLAEYAREYRRRKKAEREQAN